MAGSKKRATRSGNSAKVNGRGSKRGVGGDRTSGGGRRPSTSRMNVLAECAVNPGPPDPMPAPIEGESMLPEVEMLYSLKQGSRIQSTPTLSPAHAGKKQAGKRPTKAKAKSAVTSTGVTTVEIDEKLAVKRQKNREAAQKCRKKQRDTIATLEEACEAQSAANEALRAKIEMMKSELTRQSQGGMSLPPAFPEFV